MNRRPDFVQHKAFNLRVAKIYADVNHFQIFRDEGESFKYASYAGLRLLLCHKTG
jgi:hypothetical protein